VGKRDLVPVGVVTGAHGIRGEVKLKSFTADPAAIASYTPLTTSRGETFTITRLRPQKDHFIALLKGVSDRNRAESLRGTELFVERSLLPVTGDNEVYAHDLIGLAVKTESGEKLGTLIDMPNYGAGDLIEIEREGIRETLLIPYAESYVLAEDLENGVITVALPPGYLDDAEPENEQ
jgi:16S rRNA processing protein RimM